MREGDVVMVVGKFDERVREVVNNEPVYGTIVSLANNDVVVLLPDGNFFKGFVRDIVMVGEEELLSHEEIFNDEEEQHDSSD